MTSSKKKHHPQPASTPRATPKQTAPKQTAPKQTAPKQTAPPTVAAAKFTASRKEWIIRAVAVLGMIVGLGMVLIGATPDIAGGWGKLLLMVPGAIIIAGSFAAFIETTSNARSLRRR